MIYNNLKLPSYYKMKQKYKTFNVNGVKRTCYYNTDLELKLFELHLDCFYYKFCPICTNKLKEYNVYYHYCNDDNFFISKDCLNFKINDIQYIWEIPLSHIIYSNFNNIEINLKDISTDVENLTLITFYNNLKKYLTFQ